MRPQPLYPHSSFQLLVVMLRIGKDVRTLTYHVEDLKLSQYEIAVIFSLCLSFEVK